MAIRLTWQEDADLRERRKRCLAWLRHHQVEVGLTSSASGRSRFLLGIHTRGSPVMRIPPRPVVRPALARESAREGMAEGLLASCEAAARGDPEGTAAGFEQAGQAGADSIREYIDAGIPPPNAPVTLSGGWIYNRVAKKGVPVSGKSGDTPLRDTGALYHDFSYEVKER